MASVMSGLNARYGLSGGSGGVAQAPFGSGGRFKRPMSTAPIPMGGQTAIDRAEAAGRKYGPLQSLISTDAPLTGSQSRAIAQTPQVYRGGGSSGDASRDAYARSMADASSNQMAGTMDRYRQEFVKKAEDARSRDFTAQGQLANSAYQTERERQQVSRQQDQKRDQAIAEIRQFRRLAQADNAANRRNAMIQGIIGTGLVAATAPILGPALAGGATLGTTTAAGAAGSSPLFGQAAAGGGLLGGLMGSLSAGRYGSGGRL